MRPASKLTLSVALGATATAGLADNDPWALLSSIAIEEIFTGDTYEVVKIFPAEIENGIEKFDITGYVVPLSPGAEVTELLLVSDMGACPFCGGSDHGGSLQVSLAEPLIGIEEGARMTLRGSLEPVTDPETWQAAIMRDARVLEM